MQNSGCSRRVGAVPLIRQRLCTVAARSAMSFRSGGHALAGGHACDAVDPAQKLTAPYISGVPMHLIMTEK
jgi:hypothetical protein